MVDRVKLKSPESGVHAGWSSEQIKLLNQMAAEQNGSVYDADAPVPPPPGCATVEDHERSLLALANDLEKRGRELLESDGRVTVATANQLALAAIKARAKAADLTVERERFTRLAILQRHERAMGRNRRR
jgi:hypothetical protein